MTELEKCLLSIANNQVKQEELEAKFDEIAKIIFRNSLLFIGQNEFLITEIEFYFTSTHYNHKDPYVHADQYKTVQRQGEFGEWYFHRYKLFETYEKQKFRGLDITFGKKEHGNFGGILIREIVVKSTNEKISGIGNIVGKIIEEIKEKGLKTIVNSNEKSVFNKNPYLYLSERQNASSSPIYKSIRVIPDAKTEEKQQYRNKLYRYFNNSEIKLVKE